MRPTFDDLRRDPITFLRLYGDQAADYSRIWRWVEDVSERAIRFAREHGEIRAGDAVTVKDGEPIRLWRSGQLSASTSAPTDIYRVRFTTFGVTSASDGEATLVGQGRIEPWPMSEVGKHVEEAVLASACQIFESTWSGCGLFDRQTVDGLFGEGLKMQDINITFKTGETAPETHTLVVPRPARITAVDSQIEADEWTQVSEHCVEFPRTGATRNMFVSHNRSSVVVVALNDDGQLLTVRQWKHAIGRVTVEFPAGYLENELEDPVAAGMRELHEETGHTSDHWLYLGSFYREPGRGLTVLHVCVALECDKRTDPDPDDTEEIDVGLVGVGDIEELMSDGRMPSLHCLGAWAIARSYIQQHLEED